MEVLSYFDPSLHANLPKVVGLWEYYQEDELLTSIRKGVNNCVVAKIIQLDHMPEGRKKVIIEGWEVNMRGAMEAVRRHVDNMLRQRGYTVVD